MSTASPTVQRRGELRLPRLWPHLLGATALVTGIPVLAILLTTVAGDPRDAVAQGSVSVAPVDPADLPNPLDLAEADLPDLLEADVLIGDNPTDTLAEVDALGNPVAEAPKPKTLTIPDAGSQALAPIDSSLQREGRFGVIPGPNATGVTPLQAYKRPARMVSGRNPVALIIGGLGINEPLTQRAIAELPADVTLSFAAHAPGLQDWIDQARAAGHEVLLELPMESATFNASEPGAERALKADSTAAENRDNLHKLLTRARGYAGVINYNGDVFLPRSDAVTPMLSEIQQSGLGLFMDGSFSAPTLSALAEATDLAYAQAFGLIDPSSEPDVIASRLSALSADTGAGRIPVGVGFAYPQTLDAVKGWTATLAADNLTLVPATAALR